MAEWLCEASADLPLGVDLEATPDEALAALVEAATGDDGAVDPAAVRAGVLFYDNAGDPADPAAYLLPIATVVDGAATAVGSLVASANDALAEIEAAIAAAEADGSEPPAGFTAEAVAAARSIVDGYLEQIAAAETETEEESDEDDVAARARRKQATRVATYIRSAGEFEIRGGMLFDVRAVAEDDDGKSKRTISGHGSAFWSVDDYVTAFAPKAFKRTLKAKAGSLPLVYVHDFASVIGPIDEAAEDEVGLAFSARAVQDGSYGDYVFAHMQGGTKFGTSIGFRTVADRSGKDSDPLDYSGWPQLLDGVKPTDVRVITEAELFEITILPATFASNPKATLDGIRSRIVAELHRASSGTAATQTRSARRRTDGKRSNAASAIAVYSALAELGL